ncbi:PH domain-containing protein [Acaryochloris sp. IP29b_bin.148]|uniref:PH domain-containing protein n=1 Tax=Acaryochloris sp. IP29b_bin.148 TaxID=2969218 RepID=UPI0026196233|nr:PH domain-containing protein [Acaryochloris sp. IP29b_bin.148]
MDVATTTYSAPWGMSLKIISSVTSVLLIGIALIGLLTGPKGNWIWILSMVIIPLGILIVTALFTVRGYVLTPDALLVKRLVWTTPIPLQELTTVEADSNAMEGSIKTFGNGGLFSFSGSFRNKRLGPYRALATDIRHCVVLKFDRKAIVITPEKPLAFVNQLKAMKGME